MSEQIDTLYIKAFNNAFVLSEFNAHLLEKILQTTTENNYIQGLKDGKTIFDLTRQKSRLKDIENLRNSKNIDRDLTR